MFCNHLQIVVWIMIMVFLAEGIENICGLKKIAVFISSRTVLRFG